MNVAAHRETEAARRAALQTGVMHEERDNLMIQTIYPPFLRGCSFVQAGKSHLSSVALTPETATAPSGAGMAVTPFLHPNLAEGLDRTDN